MQLGFTLLHRLTLFQKQIHLQDSNSNSKVTSLVRHSEKLQCSQHYNLALNKCSHSPGSQSAA
jgi:hypothetical protein